MSQLIPTTIDSEHDLPAIQNEILQKGYYLANNGQACAAERLEEIANTLGGIWQQQGSQMIAPQPQAQFIAQTMDAIPPHNECAYAAEPPRFLLLHCRENAVVGGDFYLVDSHEVIRSLSMAVISLLYYSHFQCLINPVSPQTVTLLKQNHAGYHLQYSCIGHTQDWQSNTNYTPMVPLYQGYETIISELQAQLKRQELRLYHQWQVGDLLILDNQRFLHGRDEFSGYERKLDHIRIA